MADENPVVQVRQPDLKPGEFTFAGAVAGPFNIRGVDLPLDVPVVIGGQAVTPSSRSKTVIKGLVPFSVPSGPTTVSLGGKSIKAVV